MKTYIYSMTRLVRALRIGTAFGGAIFAASALQAQYTGLEPHTAATANPAEVSHTAKEFLRFAAQADQTEIAMANVAEAKAQNIAARNLAVMMSDEHQQNYEQLQALAQGHLVALDSTLDSANQRAVDRLNKTKVADFDKDYTIVMLKDHVKCIKRFDKAIAELQEPYAVEYAQNTLPALRKHLRHSEDAARAVGVDEATISSILKGLPSDEAQRVVATTQD